MDRGKCPDLLWFAALATCIKLLLVPAYRSTDFEVHRHWLAITHSLPLRQWYSDNTSEWTLDYPPFFAWFERFLAIFAHQVDPRMVDLTQGLNYASDATVLFQRLSVMAADVVLYVGIWKCSRALPNRQRALLYLAVLLSPGLLMVDNIHFQYNGFLLGILLISIGFLVEGNDVAGGVAFAVLVCFKHLFAVAGPVYFVYLLRHYCRGPNKFVRFLCLGAAVMAVVGIAFGPFVYHGQIGQVLKRLFPFGRGLCHAYWAPNFWALYNVTDKVLGFGLKKLGFSVHTVRAGLTGGLVGDFSPYAVLPQVGANVPGSLFHPVFCCARWKLLIVWFADHSSHDDDIGSPSNVALPHPNMAESRAVRNGSLDLVCIYLWVHVWLACSRKGVSSYGDSLQPGGSKVSQKCRVFHLPIDSLVLLSLPPAY